MEHKHEDVVHIDTGVARRLGRVKDLNTMERSVGREFYAVGEEARKRQ